MRKIIENKAQCLICKDVIESKYRHDFVTCSCENLSIDGGQDYLKRSCLFPDTFKELSTFEEGNDQ